MEQYTIENWRNGKHGYFIKDIGDENTIRFVEVIDGHASKDVVCVANGFVGYCINKKLPNYGEAVQYINDYIKLGKQKMLNILQDITLGADDIVVTKELIKYEEKCFKASKKVFDYIGHDRERDYHKLYQLLIKTLTANANNDNNNYRTSLIDADALKELFDARFLTDPKHIEDTYALSRKITSFELFCKRLDLLLNDSDTKQKHVCEVAYMIYTSPYTKPKYRKPVREGQRGRYAKIARVLFNAIGWNVPERSVIIPSKYNKPKCELKACFDMLFG